MESKLLIGTFILLGFVVLGVWVFVTYAL